MLRIGTSPKLVAGVPGMMVAFGEKGHTLYRSELPLTEFEVLVAGLIKARDDAYEFFRLAGLTPSGLPIRTQEPSSVPPPKRYSPPKIRLVAPTDPRTEAFLDTLPTPLRPPPPDDES